MKTPYRDGKTQVAFDPVDFIARLAALVPKPRVKLTRYHGVLATLSLGIHSLLGTAVTFHIVSIFAAAGRSQTEAFAYFLPSAVFATVTNLLCG